MKLKSSRKTQTYWLAHVIASKKSPSMVAYAKTQKLDVGQLYAWKAKFVKAGRLPITARTTDEVPLFEAIDIDHEIQVSQCCKITLPNQICIELTSLDNADQLTAFIRQLSLRP